MGIAATLISESIPRHMQPDEAEALEAWAMKAREDALWGDDVLACEVGSYHGFSTIIIAEFMKTWAIDLGGDKIHGAQAVNKIGRETWNLFVKNIGSRGLLPGRIVPICSTSDFLQSIRSPIFNFIFIDADHSYEAVLNDLVNTTRLAKPGCILALHDVYPGREQTHGYGVHQARDTFLAETSGWESIELVTTMQFFRKVN